MTLIDAKWCRKQGTHYDNEDLAELFDRPHTLLEVLTRDDGEWFRLPNHYRMWVFWRAASDGQAREVLKMIISRAIEEHDMPRPQWPEMWGHPDVIAATDMRSSWVDLGSSAAALASPNPEQSAEAAVDASNVKWLERKRQLKDAISVLSNEAQ